MSLSPMNRPRASTASNVLAFPSATARQARPGTGSMETAEGAETETPETRAQVAEPGRDNGRIKEVFLRTAYSTQLALHAMADNKSRMLLHMNGLLLSITFAMKAQLGGDQMWAAITLVSFSGISMILALIAVRPPSAKQYGGVLFNVLAVEGRIAHDSPLAAMPVESFEHRTHESVSLDQDLAVGLQRLAEALAQKHSMLRLAYGVFAAGVMTTGLLFLGSLATTAPW